MANTHSKELPKQEQGVVLLLQVPRTNDKKELAAEQMFASLQGLLTIPQTGGGFFAPKFLRERISFEIAVLGKRIGFYVWVPNYLKSFVEEQVYAQYPTVQISEVPDYTANPEKHYTTTLITEMKLTHSDVLPIKTFQSFEVDPLAAITATLAKFEDDEEAWVQMLIKPASQMWHKKTEQYLAGLKSPKLTTKGLATMLWAPPETKAETPKLAEHEQVRASAAEEKSQKLAFECSLRIVYRGNTNEQVAKLRMQSIIASYKQFNTTYLNGFESKKIVTEATLIGHYEARTFGKAGGYSLNIEEVATLYHLPHTTVETPYILWASSQTAEPPANLPIVNPGEFRADISPVAATNFRGHNTMFGLPRSDRGRHLYIIGQTGTGKSGLLELLTISDIYSPYGFALIDPHGDYAQNILRRIPRERAEDVIYFNPADTDFPMAFNPMEVTDPKLKTHTCSELIGVLKRMFDSWGPRLEYILRYSLLALIDYPEATMLDITRILTEKKFRNEVLKFVQDPVVRNFWTVEFASWNDKFAAEAVAPVLNKVGAFTANPLVRNIIGQPKSSFNIRQIMDERKILIVNLSRGLVGEDNAALLGALLVTKVQLAAMSRADVGAEQREPFYLYVDEFQNFATDSFATILSEARKYGLCLTVANQYTAQMMQEVKDAVFGNVGSLVAFRMSADDSRVMLKYFEPKFEEYDLIHMHNRHFVLSMTIGGEKVPGFSAISLNLPPLNNDESTFIIEHSRALFASSKEVVERYVGERYLDLGKEQPKVAQGSPKPPPAKPPVPVATTAYVEPKQSAPTKPAGTQPSPAPNAPKKPHDVSGIARTVMGAILHPAETAAKPVEKVENLVLQKSPDQQLAPEEGHKRKRKRSRKRKPVGDDNQPQAPQTPPEQRQPQPKPPQQGLAPSPKPAPVPKPKQPAEDPSVLHIKH